jgi:hypothetical protein
MPSFKISDIRHIHKLTLNLYISMYLYFDNSVILQDMKGFEKHLIFVWPITYLKFPNILGLIRYTII